MNVALMPLRAAAIGFTAPLALLTVSRPSETSTVLLPVIQRLPLVGVPFTVSIPSTLIL